MAGFRLRSSPCVRRPRHPAVPCMTGVSVELSGRATHDRLLRDAWDGKGSGRATHDGAGGGADAAEACPGVLTKHAFSCYAWSAWRGV
ncbi:MAG: hypothetical protein QXH32_01910 [Candidatus Caldarchaeum sp.]